MNKDSKTNKKLLIAGLLVLCFCLAVGLFVHLGGMGGVVAAPATADDPPEETPVSVTEIIPTPDGTTVPATIVPQTTVPPVTAPPTEENQPTDRVKTPEEAAPPEPPVVEDEVELTNPTQPPTYTPEQTQPSAQPSSPQGGERNSNGDIWMPGFGWVPYGGENSQGTAPNAGTGDPVGDM